MTTAKANEPATDLELLESAARAAGYEVHGMADKFVVFPEHHAGGLVIATETGGSKLWNPLTDDGDALRMAVKLFLWEAVRDGYQHVDSDNDFYAATRRAIVRAAASLAPTNRPVSPDTSA